MSEIKETNNHSFYKRLDVIKNDAEFEFDKVKKQFLDKIRDILDDINPEHYKNFNVSVMANNYTSGDDNSVF